MGRRRHLPLLIAGAIALSACTPLTAALPPLGGQSGGGITAGTRLDESLLHGMDSAYHVFATGLIDAARHSPDNGFTRPMINRGKEISSKWLGANTLARHFYDIGDAANFGAQIAAARTAQADANALLPAAK